MLSVHRVSLIQCGLPRYRPAEPSPASHKPLFMKAQPGPTALWADRGTEEVTSEPEVAELQ